MKTMRKMLSERKNIKRSSSLERNGTDIERIEDALTEFFKTFYICFDKRVYAILDRISDLESMQMNLVTIQSGLAKQLFPDFADFAKKEMSKEPAAYHQKYFN